MHIILTILLIPFIWSGAEQVGPAIFSNEQWMSLEKMPQPAYAPLTSDNWKQPTTEIYISIADFIDSVRCAKTVQNYVSKAKYPDRLKFGIIEQIEVEDLKKVDNCLVEYAKIANRSPSNLGIQVKHVEYSRRQARGSSYARVQDEEFMETEDFCLTSDAHMDVVQDWDVKLMTMWGSIGNEYAVLSTIPPAIETVGQNMNHRWEVPHLCAFKWDTGTGLPANAVPAVAINLDTPLLATSWSESFSFSRCHAKKKIPSDPAVVRLDGAVTDVLTFARLWTRGYDVYSPNRPLVFHDFMTLENKESWKNFGMSEAQKVVERERAIRRVASVLGMSSGDRSPSSLVDIGRYGLGSKRSLDQLIAFTGIDLRAGELVPAGRCKALQWVPFVPDTDPECDEDDLWGLAPENKYASHDIPLVTTSGSTPLHSSSTNDAQGRGRWSAMEREAFSYPWPLDVVDTGVHLALKELSADFGANEALPMLKVILLVVPVVVGLLLLALWALVSAGEDMRPAKNTIFFERDAKKV